MSAETENKSGAKKTPVALIVAAVVVLGAIGAFFIAGSDNKAEAMNGVNPAAAEKTAAAEIVPGDPVVANVNGEEIKRSEVLLMISQLPPQLQQMPLEHLFPMALDNLVNNKLVIGKSSSANLTADEEVKKLMDEAQVQIIRNVYLERQVAAKMDDKALQKKYADLLQRLGEIDEVKARHILLETEEQAREALKKLDAGADFATVTKEMWPGAEQQNGGELGYFAKGDMVPEFAEAAFALGVNKYTKDPIKTQFGWHVIKVEDKRKRPQPEFEAVKPQLEQEVRQEILADLLKNWQKEAKVKKFDINGNPVKSN